MGQVLLCLGMLLFIVPAKADTPLTSDGFTIQIAAAINAGRPDVPVSITAPLTLDGRTANGQSMQMNLDRIYGFCRADQARCPEIVAAYVVQARTILRLDAAAPTQASLRLAIRPETYVQGLSRVVGGAVPASSRSLPPGLLALVYLDLPATMQLQTSQDLQRLHLPESQAFAIALQNTAQALQPLDQVAKPVRPGELGGFRGTAYESSRLLLVSDWARLASQSGGHLLVAFPSAEEVLYANGSGVGALPRLSALARARFAKAERPTSPAVLEWHTDGWSVAAP